MSLTDLREILKITGVIFIGAGCMFFGGGLPPTQPAVSGSGFALMAVAGTFRDIAMALIGSGLLLLLLGAIPFPRRKKRPPRKP